MHMDFTYKVMNCACLSASSRQQKRDQDEMSINQAYIQIISK